MSNTVIELAKSGAAEDLRAEMRREAENSLYYFSKVVLGYDKLVDHLHLPFAQDLQETEYIRKRGKLYPRGHFKSTIASKSYTLWRLSKNHNLRILIVGESDKVAAKNLKDIKWNLQSNEMLQWLYPELIPEDFSKTKWTETEILLPRDKSFDESSISTMGVGAKGTGFHYDLILYDDIIGEEASHSPALMQDAIDWFQAAPGLLNNPEESEEVIIGTRWLYGEADLYGWIMAHLPAGLSSEGRPFGFTWHIRSAVENNEVIFPERFSLETLEDIRKRQKDYLYSCNYLNKPIAPKGGGLNSDWLKSYKIGDDYRTLIPQDGTPPTNLSKLYRMSVFDPSGGGQYAKAENAIVVTGMDSLSRLFVLGYFSKNNTLREAIEEWLRLNDKFRCSRNMYEAVGAFKSIGATMAEIEFGSECSLCRKEHNLSKKHLPIFAESLIPDGGAATKAKQDRDRAYLEVPLQEGRIYVRAGMDDLRSQLSGFLLGGVVDLLDCLAYCQHYSIIPPSDSEVELANYDLEVKRSTQSSRIATEYDYGGYV